MRFFAALGVVQYHLWENYFRISIAHPGTDFFLVLVGVVASYIHARQIPTGNWWRYIRDRYRRLYVTFIPLFIITLLVKLKEASIVWVVKSFLFIPLFDRLPVIGSTWMVSMFLLFYFLFSLCFWARSYGHYLCSGASRSLPIISTIGTPPCHKSGPICSLQIETSNS
jgi:hypothetical protein